jgi:F5/8 type C domain
MLKRVLVVVAVVAGCQGPESFHDRPGAGGEPGGVTGVAGSPGVAGAGVLPIMVTGQAGTGSGPAGAAGSDPLAGQAGATAGNGTVTGAAGVGAAGNGTVTGAAGTGAAGTGIVTGGAGASAGATGTPDAGGTGRPDAGAPDAAADVGAPSVAYASTAWKPTASITAAGTADLPPNAFDGKLATRWTTGRNQTGDETFVVDLGQSVPVSRVVLDDTTNPLDFPVAYTLEVSTDNKTFTAVQMGRGATVTDVRFTRVVARYVRIRQTGMTAAAGSWWSIDELRIYS